MSFSLVVLRFNLTSCRRIYWAAMAFTSVAIITSLFIKDVSENMTNNVAVILENDRGEEKLKEVEP